MKRVDYQINFCLFLPLPPKTRPGPYPPPPPFLYAAPQGRIHATRTEPATELEAATPAPPDPIVTSSGSNNPSTLNLFQRMVLLTEGMNTLKCQVNAEKQSRCVNPAHTDPVSDDEEELEVPVLWCPLLCPCLRYSLPWPCPIS